LAECSKRARSFQSTCSGFSQFHRTIVWLRRYYRWKFIYFFKKNHDYFMNLNFFGISGNFGRICYFRPFESFGFFWPFELWPLASLPARRPNLSTKSKGWKLHCVAMKSQL
jgi:hypothetical protein